MPVKKRAKQTALKPLDKLYLESKIGVGVEQKFITAAPAHVKIAERVYVAAVSMGFCIVALGYGLYAAATGKDFVAVIYLD